jgi:hypothetical protein
METMNLPSGFSPFKLNDSQDESRRNDFAHHFFKIDLSPPEMGQPRPGQEQFRRIAENYNKPGIYFWVMRYGDADDLFSIYVGKTKSLANRVKNYLSEFQPHSPNDFKLRIFQSYLSKAVPFASLDLLFAPCPENELTLAEKEFIRKYKPLLNIQRGATDEARLGLQLAFEQFYHSAFENLLQRNAS